jgi:hypothetical protein
MAQIKPVPRDSNASNVVEESIKENQRETDRRHEETEREIRAAQRKAFEEDNKAWSDSMNKH